MQPLRSTPTFTPPQQRSWKRALFLLALVGTVAGAVVLVLYYHSRSLPQVRLGQASAGNQTLPELQATAKRQFKAMRFQFVGKAKTVVASSTELGVMLKSEETAQKAFAARRNLAEALQLWRSINTPLVLSYNQGQIIQFLHQNFGNEFSEPVSANLRYDANLKEFRVVEGKPGRGFVVAEVIAALQSQAWRPETMTIYSRKTIQPERTVLTIASTGDEANRIVRLKLTFLYRGKVMYITEPNDIAAWLEFEPSATPGKLRITYDRPKIIAFLRQNVTQSLNDFYGPEGSIPAEDPLVPEPANPLRLEVVDDLVSDIIAALGKQTHLEKELKVAQ